MRAWFALIGLVALSARADDAPVCPTDGDWLEPTVYLKSVSLDLRGVVPTLEEYQQVEEMGAVPDEWIDQWLNDEAFYERVVRLHRDMLWNNVSDAQLISAAYRMRTTSGIYWRNGPASNYRNSAVYCGDFEANIVDGYPQTVLDPETGNRLEGWVEVNPYWAPETTIKVCAFDAQERLFSSKGTDCSTADGRSDMDCGCGENLKWCAYSSTHNAVGASFTTDLDLRVAENLRRDSSYIELLTGRFGYVNGPIVDFYKNRTAVPNNVSFSRPPVDVAGLPDLAFTDVDEWHRVDLGPQHSGILTSPAFLLRFQTNRARADRFYNTFLCQPFEAPDTGLEGLDDPNPTLDLTARAGCNGCHALLEPAGAYWGRWMEQGGGFLDEIGYPAFDEGCYRCSTEGYPCSDSCRRFYLTDPISSEQNPYVGWLNSFSFLDDAHFGHVDGGPELLVNRTASDGRLSSCVTKRAIEFLIGRPTRTDESVWISEMQQDFIASDYRFKDLIRAIVTSENYRRLR